MIFLKEQKYFSWLLSLSGHLALVLGMILYFQFSMVPVKWGLENSQVISSYFYPQTSLQHNTLAMKSPSSQITAEIQKATTTQQMTDQGIQIAKKNISVTKVVNHSVTAQSKASANTSNGQAVSELVALLHSAIQQQQKYPDSAREMERSGRAVLAFVLHEDGTVSQLRIVKSSGTDSLDNAALAAVNNAVPFQQVNRYIHAPKEYRIDVVFELA